MKIILYFLDSDGNGIEKKRLVAEQNASFACSIRDFESDPTPVVCHTHFSAIKEQGEITSVENYNLMPNMDIKRIVIHFTWDQDRKEFTTDQYDWLHSESFYRNSFDHHCNADEGEGTYFINNSIDEKEGKPPVFINWIMFKSKDGSEVRRTLIEYSTIDISKPIFVNINLNYRSQKHVQEAEH